MKHLSQILAAFIFASIFCGANVFAQPQPQQRMDWANMNPQQIQQMIQQRMMESLREQLAVTNDAEWGVIEQRLSKVTQLRMETMLSASMGFLGGMRRGGNMPGGRMGALGGLVQSDPSVETLQSSVDSNAPTEQIKTALARLRESRKQKQAELAKAQADLRSVLTTRQEAILVLAGMLD